MKASRNFADEVSRLTGINRPVDTSTLARSLYSSDSSLYRVVPAGVFRPRDGAELEAILDAARGAGVPVTGRGAGTSVAGNAVGPGLIVDCGRHLRRIRMLDSDARQATVEPGVVQASLTAAAAPHGLRFGPDPSTLDRCTIGGMIGNNACGPRALGYGRTADNVVALEVVTGTGERLLLDSRHDARGSASRTLRALEDLVMANLGVIRTEFGTFSRQISGYSLEHLLPEKGFDVARFLAGSEGTLAMVTAATVSLVADDPHKAMITLGYPSMAEAADAMPAILPFSPTACEGLDRRIVEVVARTRGRASVPELPRGRGWLMVELTDTDPRRLSAQARDLLAGSGALDGAVVEDPRLAADLWRIRADGAGLAGVSLDRPAHSGWEDAAVPPARLGAYLRDFDLLLGEHGLSGLPYGHFGEGCVHVRIDFPLTEPDGPARYRRFIENAADLVAGYGGSMSGEHGDGRARSELLPRMYSPEALALFGAVKAIFDPDNLLNPGVLVDPRPLDADLRLPQVRTTLLRGAGPGFVADVHRCTGVGKCLADNTATGGVMCPSYLATGEEKDSTRGRARVLQEMVNGTLVTGGWRASEVHEALDLCLSCKGCSTECPTGTDMAAYKSRVLEESYRRRLRPRSHYTLGRLPRWGRLVTSAPALSRLANLTLAVPVLGSLAKWLAGVDRRRALPRFATAPARTATPVPQSEGGTKPVVIWVDSFSDFFEGDHVAAMVAVLVEAGYAPRLLERTACCGLSLITTGQREEAAREIRASIEALHPVVAEGIPIVGTEPSCLATWRSDARELVDDPRVDAIARGVHTLAELLSQDRDWHAPDLTGHTIVAQPHCHHRSVLGWAADAALLAATGADVVTVGGCCGLAGNFGVEIGHYETSVAVAEHDLLPAVRDAGPGAIILADGFSCRVQLSDLAGRQALTLAELLAAHPRGGG